MDECDFRTEILAIQLSYEDRGEKVQKPVVAVIEKLSKTTAHLGLLTRQIFPPKIKGNSVSRQIIPMFVFSLHMNK